MGDAQVGGIVVSRLLNGLCYVVGGIALISFGLQGDSPEGGTLGALALGACLMGYGAKVLFTRSAYWVSSAVYLLVTVAVLVVVGRW